MNLQLESQTSNSSQRILRWQHWNQRAEDLEFARKALTEFQLNSLSGKASALGQCRAIVLGLGAVGGVAFEHLVRGGVGHVDGVDPDRYGRESFLTQSSMNHAGQAKAMVLGAQASKVNPAVQVRTAVGQAQDLRLRDIRRADVILVAGDNLELPLWVGRTAMVLKKPMVQVAVHRETDLVIVRSYDLRNSKNTCPRCSIGAKEIQQQKSRFGCDPSTRVSTSTASTRTLSTVCAAAGSIGANEAIKFLTGNDEHALRGEEYTLSMLTYMSMRTTLPRRQNCDASHEETLLIDVSTPASATSLRTLAEMIGCDHRETLLQVRSEMPWVSFTICASCERVQPVRKFARFGRKVGNCDCGHFLTTVPQGMKSIIPGDDLRECWELPLNEIGLEDGEAVAMLDNEQWVYFFTPNDETEN